MQLEDGKCDGYSDPRRRVTRARSRNRDLSYRRGVFSEKRFPGDLPQDPRTRRFVHNLDHGFKLIVTGAGYVEEIGAAVTVAKPGDPVLLSFASCSNCTACKDSHPAYCPDMPKLNYFSEPGRYFAEDKTAYGGSYFGQSSFASLTPCKQTSVVNVAGLVKDEEELKMFSPLGCGFQTGSGAVTNIAQAGKKDTIVVMGLGGVGLAALMTAKIRECSIIIGVDRFQDRLEFARSLGATHIVNTSNPDVNLVEAVKAITDGVGTSITVDTTGYMGLIKAGVEFTANRGQFIFIGVPPSDAELSVHLVTLIQVSVLTAINLIAHI